MLNLQQKKLCSLRPDVPWSRPMPSNYANSWKLCGPYSGSITEIGVNVKMDMKISEGYLVSGRRGGEEIVSTFRYACKSELSKRWVSAVTILQM